MERVDKKGRERERPFWHRITKSRRVGFIGQEKLIAFSDSRRESIRLTLATCEHRATPDSIHRVTHTLWCTALAHRWDLVKWEGKERDFVLQLKDDDDDPGLAHTTSSPVSSSILWPETATQMLTWEDRWME